MKKCATLVLFGLFFLNFVSAQFFPSYGGGYGSFSITGFFDSFGLENLIYLLLFVIFFMFISRSIIKLGLFRGRRDMYGRTQENKGTAVVLGMAISLLAVAVIYRSGYDVVNLFSWLGISSDSLYPLLALVLLLLIIFVILRFKLGFSGFLMLLGIFLAGIALFTELIYERGMALLIGVILLIVGFLMRKSSKAWMRENMRTV